jgi:hypothetical protein
VLVIPSNARGEVFRTVHTEPLVNNPFGVSASLLLPLEISLDFLNSVE